MRHQGERREHNSLTRINKGELRDLRGPVHISHDNEWDHGKESYNEWEVES
jgi:hypothetical protein